MRIVRASDLRAAPWKNGGGETREVAIFPPRATLETFDWRLSMATVASDGPFSIFEGVDRTLVLLEGGGLSLDFADGETAHLKAGESLSFAADRPVAGRLTGGPVRDLNLMYRRGVLAPTVLPLSIDGSVTRPALAPTAAVFVLDGQVQSNGQTLGAYDTAIFDEPADCAISGRGRILWIDLASVGG